MFLPFVSIILPVYNSYTFIHRALDCILAQTYQDFEVLIIDDGSDDGTAEICDDYSNIDQRIRVFHKKNGGVASARQMGIEHARGEYSIHFDADDIATSDMLLKMCQTAVNYNADVVIADFFEKKPDGTIKYVKQSFTSNLSSDILVDILERKIFGALWHKLIRTSLYSKKSISFDPRVNYCEDVLIEAKMFKDDDVKIAHHPYAHYTYCHDNPDSITINYNKEKLKARLAFLNELKKVLDKQKFNHAFEETVWDVKMEAFRHGILDIDNFNATYPNSIRFLLHANCPRILRIRLIINALFC